MALPQDTTTIEEFIQAGKASTITYPKLSFLEIMSNGTQVSARNVINDYIYELKSVSTLVELSREEQNAYYYKPKLLCYDIYGNPELYYIILLLNDIADVKEFTKPRIRMLQKSYMNSLLSQIYNSEKQAIDAYNKKNS